MMTVDQFQRLLAAIEALRDHTQYWRQFLATALPIFLASILGFLTALLLDWLKTRREKNKIIKESLEKELAQLSSVSTGIGFNVEALIHTVYQQILPHYKASHEVLLIIEKIRRNDPLAKQKFDTLFYSHYQQLIMMRSPDLHLIEVDFFKDLPFIIQRDPNVLKLSGWAFTYISHLKRILGERNKQIDIATINDAEKVLNLEVVARVVETQASIAKTEILNTYQLLLQLKEMSAKLEEIIKQDYDNVVGKKLRVQFPDVFNDMMGELELIAKTLVPEWPPPEQGD